MRKTLLLLFALMTAVMAQAGINKVRIEIDYQQGVYYGHTFEDIVVLEEDFLNDQMRYESRFMDGMEKSFAGAALISDEPREGFETVHITILNVNSKGRLTAEVRCGNLIETFSNLKGGTFGTWINLFGDGMESLGRAVGLWLNADKVK